MTKNQPSKDELQQAYSDIALSVDYKETPVSINTLLDSPEFFGSLTNSGHAVYSIWREKLNDFMPQDRRFIIVITGAIGMGKTRAAVWGMSYVMHKVLCLRDPWGYFSKTGGGKMCVVFFNLTKTLGSSKGFRLLQDYMLASPWFCKHGRIRGKEKTEQWLDIPLFDYVLASPYASGFGAIGSDIITSIMDEVDSPNETEKTKAKVLSAYESAILRFKSRFVDHNFKDTLGKFFLVASKQEEASFLNTFVEKRKKDKSVFIVDVPFWSKFNEKELSGNKFPIMLGDVYAPSKIIVESERQSCLQQGYQVMDIPVEFYHDFDVSIDKALRDIAGVATVGLRRSKLFPSEKSIVDCFDKNKVDPANLTTVVVGLTDTLDLVKFINFDAIRLKKSIPRFIHCDIAYSGDGDALGLSMCGVKDWVKSDYQKPDGSYEVRRVPVVETDFVIRFKGRPVDSVPLYKIRKLVLDIRSAGYTIQMFTADLNLLSEDTKQLLSLAGISCDALSLDKTPEPYLMFRDLVFEGRWICHRNQLLLFELANLEYDKEKNKIDHPKDVSILKFEEEGDIQDEVVSGSKDLSDACAGAVYSCLKAAPAEIIEAYQVKSIMNTLTQMVSKEKDPTQIFTESLIKSSEKEQAGEVIQYQLQDVQGQFWLWSRDKSGLSPVLTGPFKNRLLYLDVIKVENPVKFSPDKKDGGKLDKTMVDVLKFVRDKSR